MLRNSLVSALILLYSASTIGLPLHFHYCRGELKHVTVLVKMECHPAAENHLDHTCCEYTKADCERGFLAQGCCDDNTQWVLDDDPAICSNTQPTGQTISAPAVYHSSFRSFEVIDFGIPVATPGEVADTGPPVYLMQCSLIFYG